MISVALPVVVAVGVAVDVPIGEGWMVLDAGGVIVAGLEAVGVSLSAGACVAVAEKVGNGVSLAGGAAVEVSIIAGEGVSFNGGDRVEVGVSTDACASTVKAENELVARLKTRPATNNQQAGENTRR